MRLPGLDRAWHFWALSLRGCYSPSLGILWAMKILSEPNKSPHLWAFKVLSLDVYVVLASKPWLPCRNAHGLFKDSAWAFPSFSFINYKPNFKVRAFEPEPRLNPDPVPTVTANFILSLLFLNVSSLFGLPTWVCLALIRSNPRS